MRIQTTASASRVERVLLLPLVLICIHTSFLVALFALNKMLGARVRNVTTFVVAGLAGSAALYGYQARFSTGNENKFCFGFGIYS